MSWAPMAAAAGGQIVGSLVDSIFGNGNQMEKVDTLNRGQKQLLNQLTGMLDSSGSLGRGYQSSIDYQRQLMDPSSQAVNAFTQPYMNQFNQQTIPGLAERFAGMGAMGGGLSSSGFGQALGSAGGNLQAQLAQLKAGLGQQAAQSLMGQYGNMSNQAFSVQPFAYQQQAPSAMGGVMQGLAQGGFGSAFQGMGGGGYGGGSGGYGMLPSYSSIQSNPLVQQAQLITG